MHDIESHIAGTRHTEHRIEVGTVIIEQRATLMHKLSNLGYRTLEEAERIWVGHHHRSHGLVEQRTQCIDIDSAVSE